MLNSLPLYDELRLTSQDLAPIRHYIKHTWKTLTRSPRHIVKAARDPKLEYQGDQPLPVYLSAREDYVQVENKLRQLLSPEELAQIELQVLPPEMNQIEHHGLLYLPGEYVVPGGRFNELYGWDSYFIQLGLLQDGEIALAQSMIDQLLYEIEHYGTVLNGNRTYMLNRSQPPFLTRMILDLYHRTHDLNWLRSVLPTVQSYYFYWTVPPHLNQATGLSHYNAFGVGPAPEVISSEIDENGKNHYERILEYYRTHEIEDYDVSLYYDQETDSLTDLFYQGDRSMRESGFDPTNRFGPFSVDIIHYAPVCLNSLLYQMELDLAEMQRILGYGHAASYWLNHAENRRHLMNQYLWDDEVGLYFDYNFRTGCCRRYEFVTTFFPLWVGLASPEQAQRVALNLSTFETPGGLVTSTHFSGNQWDEPFGWAPLHLIAVDGLRRYGYIEEAHRIACKFVNLVLQEFNKTGTIVEKYDVKKCSADVSDEIFFGYSSNEIGFGWTNGVVLELLAMLERDGVIV
ncbi:Alpha,alpha-trehalase [Rippkaea orientalis PCC 8801]|uniref:Alpha,alpha-trehalase n=1 Tax=Rippkaea orientalis (strain PCC 8801 / RF-1) TaxID=41431 RepID=B7K4J1_RIPO1|nr:trehalase family glycosidase [Rippkaea orientalis]ACK65456.1 Alpha,alpha-trehalase [Rippkaea orientalis PCC 8801]